MDKERQNGLKDGSTDLVISNTLQKLNDQMDGVVEHVNALLDPELMEDFEEARVVGPIAITANEVAARLKTTISEELLDTIERVEKMDDPLMESMRVYFNNGCMLSIVRGYISYGGRHGFYEVAPFNSNGDMDGSLLGIVGDDVEGYLTPADVHDRLIKMSRLGRH